MSGKNLAILIGVSEYDSYDNLEGCQADFGVMKKIITASGKFQVDDSLFLDTNTTSSHVKLKLSEFIEDHRGSEIAEVFFYFFGSRQLRRRRLLLRVLRLRFTPPEIYYSQQ